MCEKQSDKNKTLMFYKNHYEVMVNSTQEEDGVKKKEEDGMRKKEEDEVNFLNR
uniref:Uncharacterized protein n=1 Tax=Acrobeloides nanus TaxID=290746 RepID=A0A914CH96_9BILA